MPYGNYLKAKDHKSVLIITICNDALNLSTTFSPKKSRVLWHMVIDLILFPQIGMQVSLFARYVTAARLHWKTMGQLIRHSVHTHLRGCAWCFFSLPQHFHLSKQEIRDVPVVLRVRFHLPKQRAWVQTLGGEDRPHASWPKKKNQEVHNRGNIITCSIKTSKMVHI